MGSLATLLDPLLWVNIGFRRGHHSAEDSDLGICIWATVRFSDPIPVAFWYGTGGMVNRHEPVRTEIGERGHTFAEGR